ncbi:MAG TPA: hypothetical protein PKE21_13920 [Flavobacteriales bacterium]|nr:hypothetical protein [Flavobacteriales bacterium]HMR28575.1 hypothetical protein [Flavobacteriales bacterium]
MATPLRLFLAWIVVLGMWGSILPPELGALHTCAGHSGHQHDAERHPGDGDDCAGCALALAEALVLGPLQGTHVEDRVVRAVVSGEGTAPAGSVARGTTDRGPPSRG